MAKKRFSKTKPFNKTNISEVDDSLPAVYRLKNNKSDDLYIGIAKRGRVQERLGEHLTKKGEKIPGASKFQTSQFRNKEQAERKEKQLIKKLKPKYND